MASRLVLTYSKEEGVRPDFCEGHSPAVTVTFVCPSERREVSRLPGCRERERGRGRPAGRTVGECASRDGRAGEALSRLEGPGC